MALVGVGVAVGGDVGRVLGVLAPVVPGVLVGILGEGISWRVRGADLGLAALAVGGGWLAVVIGTGLSAAVGLAEWSLLDAGVIQAWNADPAGAVALDASAPVTLALAQGGMVLGAPIYGLPQGLGLAVWSRSVPPPWRPAAVGALAAVVFGVSGGAGEAVAALLFAAWAVAAAGRSLWAAALGLASLVGLPLLGALLAAGPPSLVGWTAPGTLAMIGSAGLVAVLARRWPRS